MVKLKGYLRKKMPNRIIKEREVSLPIQPIKEQKLPKPEVIIKEVPVIRIKEKKVNVIKYRDRIVRKEVPVKVIKEVEIIKKVFIPRPVKPKLTPEESYKRMLENSAKWNLTQKILGAERRIIRMKEDIIKLEAYVKEMKGGQTQNESLSVVG